MGWQGSCYAGGGKSTVAPLEMPEPDKSSQEFPEVFTACAVNRAMKRSNAVKEEKKCHNIALPLSDFSVSLSCSELVVEQQADMSLKGLFAQVRPASEVVDSAWGDFLQDLLLVRKWLPHAGLDGDPVFQIAVPTKFRSAVLKIAHDESGHAGVRKTYDRVLRQFFWPRIKKDISSSIKTCHICQLTEKRKTQLCHVNLSKQYYVREATGIQAGAGDANTACTGNTVVGSGIGTGDGNETGVLDRTLTRRPYASWTHCFHTCSHALRVKLLKRGTCPYPAINPSLCLSWQ